MNRPEHLWSKLREECGEVAAAVDKLLAFGPHDTNVKDPEGPHNLGRVQAEVIDLLGILWMLNKAGHFIVPEDIIKAMETSPWGPAIEAKVAKVVRFAHYAHQTGALDKAPMEAPVPTCMIDFADYDPMYPGTQVQVQVPMKWDWQIDSYVGPPGSDIEPWKPADHTTITFAL